MFLMSTNQIKKLHKYIKNEKDPLLLAVFNQFHQSFFFFNLNSTPVQFNDLHDEMPSHQPNLSPERNNTCQRTQNYPCASWSRLSWPALTIRKYTGLPVLQDLVKLLSKLLVAWITEQVILPAFGMKML